MIVKEFLLKRRWIILTFAFAAVTLATSAYLVFREIYRPKKPNAILSKYGYLFREKNDMDILNRLIEFPNRQEVDETDEPAKDTCKLSCHTKTNIPQQQNQVGNNANTTDIFTLSNNTVVDEDELIVTYLEPVAAPLRDERKKFKHSYHGCCMSNQSFISPTALEDADTGKMLRIVQFRTKSQYFLTDHCKQVKDCKRGCKCRQQTVVAVAVVVDSPSSQVVFDENSDKDREYIEKHARIQLVKYGGWCKCFNV